ncbi:hypothetical protein ACFL5S_01830 [Fibrobacterota bacterium]
MKRILKLTVIVFLWINIIHAAKVLVIVEPGYYDYDSGDDGFGLIDEYINLVRTKDGYDVELISDFQATGRMIEQCGQLWELIADEYQDEKIEGAVLVGDLPIPIFIQHDDNVVVPIDYLYMDVCDANGQKYNLLYDPPNPIVGPPLPNGPGVWNTIQYEIGGEINVYFDWIRSNDAYYDGDGTADIWASRIYPVELDGLREEGALWGDFLEEYEVLDSYLGRVIKRMKSQAEVPPRAMAIGYAYHNWAPIPNEQHNLGLLQDLYAEGPTQQLHHVLYPNNSPEAYQAQLQNGPYGGDTWGATGGFKFPDGCKINSTFPEYEGDTRGYEAACLFVHSAGNAHGWHDVHGIANDFDSHGSTRSILPCMPWTYETAPPGFDGSSCQPDWFKTQESYYKVSRDFLKGMMGWPYQSSGVYHFPLQTISGQRDFDAHVYIPDHGSQQSFKKVYINIYVDDPAYFYVNASGDEIQHIGWYLDIVQGASGWTQLWLNHHTVYDLDGDNTIKISITSIDWDELSPDELITMDAVRLTMVNPNQVWYKDNPIDMDLMKPHHYRTDRSIMSMRDDGGPSKAKFTFMNACQPSNFLVRHNIGNLYALAHNGLISIGRPTTCSWIEYGNMFEDLKNGASFGKAYLDQVNDEGFPSKGYLTLALLGAGTLKASAYIPYTDAVNAEYSEDIHTKWSYWVANTATVTDMELYYENGQNYNPELNLYAGNEILLKPDGKGVTFCSGSEVNLKIKQELQNAQ